jgi:hypothetical protein
VAIDVSAPAVHPPMWMGGPGDTDVLFYVTLIFLIAAVFGAGLFHPRLHALPEHLAHGESKVKLLLDEAEARFTKSTDVADVDGRLEQFTLRAGDLVNPMIRPAGVLIPIEAGRVVIVAGFGQIEAQVLRPGMIAEAACPAKPFEIIPAVVTQVQSVVASGQLRPSDLLVDPAQVGPAGSLTVFIEALFDDGFAALPPGSNCVVNVYTSNCERLQSPDVGTFEGFLLHAIDATGLVHALILRIQAIMMPIRTLVLSGGH